MFPHQKDFVSWIFLFTSIFGMIKFGGTTEARVVCYYTNWSVYRPGTAKFNPQNINPYLCTHLIYAFGGFTKDNTLKPFDKYQDIEQGGYAKFTGLKSYNKNLKTMLAIGGWNEGSSRFSSLVASPDRRQQFTKNTVKFLRQNHFDGLDLDWEYPAHRDGGKPRDRDNYAQFVQELREEFNRESSKTGRPRLLLTMAVPAGIEYIKKGYDIKKLNKYLDWFNLLSYDYHSAFEPSVNHHSPLYPLEEESEYNYDTDLNIDHSVKYYLNEGADRDKLVLGLPTYGRSYTLLNDEDTDIGSPADGPGAQGDATREKGYLAYYEICQNIRDDHDWTVVQPNPKAMGPYAFKGNQWVGYDDESILRKKGEYVVANGLGGIMFWSIDNDDFRGNCHGRPYPLIEAAKESMLNSLGLGDNEVVGPSRRAKPTRQRSRQGSLNRITSLTKDDDESTLETTRRPSSRRRLSSSNKENYEESSYVPGRTTTPEPPTTPDPGADFKCEDEGFFPNPRDCKKYFWCLDSGPSNLGIVAHQFTCPSGLVFNKESDSCDYTRNVVCKITEPTKKPHTTTTTSTDNSRTTAPRRTTTKSPLSVAVEEYEYEDGDDAIFKEVLEEEDPKVIKDLIDLIKRAGGIEELEKQLHLEDDGSMIVNKSNSEQSSTTPGHISKSLYEKVLNSANVKSFSPRNRFTPTFTKTDDIDKQRNYEEITSKRNVENKYSSVIRNSRPGPQNDGIENKSELGSLFRPEYVTINRSKLSSQQRKDDEDVEENYETTESEGVLDDADDVISSITTSFPKYVNIRRSKPVITTTSSEPIVEQNDENVNDDDAAIETTSKKQYGLINRSRTTPQTLTDEKEFFATNANRYKAIERRRPTTTESAPDSPNEFNGDFEIESSTTVPQNSLYNINTNDKTTRAYANFARKTTENKQTTTTINEPITTTTTHKFIATTEYPYTIKITTTKPEIATISDSPTDYSTILSHDIDSDNNQNEVTTLANIESQNQNTFFESSISPFTFTPTFVNSDKSVNTESSNTNKIPSTTTTTTTTTSTTATSVFNSDKDYIVKEIVENAEVVNNNNEVFNMPEFYGSVSSPRPFGISKRTRRPTSYTTANTPTSSVPIITTKVRTSNRPKFRRPIIRKTTVAPSNEITLTTEATTFIFTNKRRKIPTISTATRSPSPVTKNTTTTARRKFNRPIGDRRRIVSTTKATNIVSTTEISRTTNPLFRRRFGYSTTRKPTTTEKAPATELFVKVPNENDQKIEPSIQDTKFTSSRFNQIGEDLSDSVIEAITFISKAPLPFISTSTSRYTNFKSKVKYNEEQPVQITKRIGTNTATERTIIRITQKPTRVTTTVQPATRRNFPIRQKPHPFQRAQRLDSNSQTTELTHKPTLDYDYYDDGDLRIVGKTNSKVKVILHEEGIIECLDQGNFPHPLSCRKFISCAKMETGGVVGWEYTCPKGLSYDPVGSMCNWSAGLGCKE